MNNNPINEKNTEIPADNSGAVDINAYSDASDVKENIAVENFAEAVRLANLKRRSSAAKKVKKKGGNKTSIIALVSLASVLCLSVVIFAAFALIGNMFVAEGSANNAVMPYDAHNDRISEEQKKKILDGLFAEPVYDFPNEEMRGVWIASVININYPSKPGLTEKELKSELDGIVKNAVDTGMNTVFFQVRPTSDALYPSEIFPYSAYVSGTQGVAPHNGFDSLDYLIKKAAENGIDVHAWVNPFRVTMNESDEAKLAATNPAVMHPEYTVKYADGKTYYNPALPEVRALIIDGVKELAVNYPELKGIHFDDYFYPYPSGNAEFDDEDEYLFYGSGMSKDDWRRFNVNTLIHDTYYALKGVNPNIKFGVSPFGIWANSGSDTPTEGSISSGLEAYSSLYCDALAWAKGGYVDYLIPQIYWSFSTSTAPFDNIARWWNKELDGTGVDYYIGLAAYKAVDYAENEIGIQVEFSRNLLSCKGCVYYGYADIANNTKGLKDKIKELNKYPVRCSVNSETDEKAKIYTPSNNSTLTTNIVSMSGKSNPAQPFTINGKKLSRTKEGYFSVYETLNAGSNSYVLDQNGVTTTHTVNYKTKREAASSKPAVLDSFAVTEVYPSFEAWYRTGEKISVRCTAPAGCVVTAQIGGMTITLSPTMNQTGNAKYLKEVYVGDFYPYALSDETSSVTLGTLTVTAARFGETHTAQGGLIKQMGTHAPVYAEIIKDYTHLKISPSSSFYDDYTPASIGMRDYITKLEDSYYKLAFGGYVSVNDIKIVAGVNLNENRILSVKAAVNGNDTINNKNNFTDVVFECLENAPVNAVASDGKIDVVFYNTNTELLPEPVISANPLFSFIAASADKENGTVTYTVHLKNALNCYGYNIVYENGNIILRMKNPQSLDYESGLLLSGKTIVIDAGHGGTDIGAPGCGAVNESELNLAIALHLKDELTALGANVVMTRTDYNQTVALLDRTDFLTETDPDLAISIHQNSIDASANTQKIRGYLGLYGSEAGKLLAKTVSSRVCSELNRYERAYAYQKLAVARNHRFPSTLCEMLFVSNFEEYNWAVTEGNSKRSAQALAKGIIDYYLAQEAYLEY